MAMEMECPMGKPSLGFTPGPMHDKSLGTLRGSMHEIMEEGHNFSKPPKPSNRPRPLRDLRKIAPLDPRKLPGARGAGKLAKKAGKVGVNLAKKAGKAGISAAKKGVDVAKKVFDPFGLFGGGGYKKKPRGSRERVRQRSQSGPEGKGSHYQAASVRKAFRKGTYRVQEARRVRAAAVKSAQARGESKSRVQEIRAAGTADVRAKKIARSARINVARKARIARKSTVSFAVPKKVY